MLSTIVAACRTAMIFGIGLALVGPALAEVLITPDEAALPAATAVDMSFRGVTRAPKVHVVSPKANGADIASPMKLMLTFQAFGGSSIDPNSVKFTYLKKPSVDLTKRLKAFIKNDGVEMPIAEVPPGIHAIRIDVKDSQGRAGTNFLIFTVKK